MSEAIVTAIKNSIDERKKLNHNSNYVEWQGRKVKIPNCNYNAGGTPVKYTAEKVISTLDFYYKMLVNHGKRTIENRFREILDEEHEENHHKSLFDAVTTKVIREKRYTLEDLHPLLINRR